MLSSPPRFGLSLWNVCVTKDQGYVPLVVNTSRSFPQREITPIKSIILESKSEMWKWSIKYPWSYILYKHLCIFKPIMFIDNIYFTAVDIFTYILWTKDFKINDYMYSIHLIIFIIFTSIYKYTNKQKSNNKAKTNVK